LRAAEAIRCTWLRLVYGEVRYYPVQT